MTEHNPQPASLVAGIDRLATEMGRCSEGDWPTSGSSFGGTVSSPRNRPHVLAQHAVMTGTELPIVRNEIDVT